MWWDYYKLFTYSFEEDPQTKLKKMKDLTGAGHTQPDALPDIRSQDGSYWGGGRGLVRLRDSQDFIDLSTVTNRQSRYKEYERLRNVPEIETAMTVFSDEACIAGHEKISTPFYGCQQIKWFAENKPNERFLVYCWDFDKEDYTLGWAYAPRKVKTSKTIRIKLDDGTAFVVTHDHKILMRSGEWKMAGELKKRDKLMPFYRLPAHRYFNEQKGLIKQQFPRIFTFKEGWKHERQFIDEWRLGRKEKKYEKVNQACRILSSGVHVVECAKMMGHQWNSVNKWMDKEGFSLKEVRQLGKKRDYRCVLHVEEWREFDVYDLSVEDHENFCGESVVFHNCQKGENNHVLEVRCSNEEIQKELEWLFFHRKMLNLDRRAWHWMKQLCIFGDFFLEVVIDPENPKDGILKMQELPPDSMYRIETTKGKLIEFQQSNEGPDYQSLTRPPVTQATEADLQQANALRFAARQVVHMKIGDDRKTFYPYGVSLIEPARGPAHQLRLMEDAMVVYRLCIRTYDKITVRGGWKYMKDICVDDIIYSYNQDTGTLEESKVAWHGLVGKKTTYKVASKHTSVTGTSIHPIIVYDSETKETEYVRIKDIIPGRHCFIRPLLNKFKPKKINRYYKSLYAVLTKEQKQKYKNTIYSNKKKLIEESLLDVHLEINKKNIQKCWTFLAAKHNGALPLELGNAICERFELGDPLKKNKGEKTPERICLPEHVNEEFASLLGFLFGDGCINWNKGSAKLLFAAGEHEEINEKYSKSLNKFFGNCHFQQDKRLSDGLGIYCTNSATTCEILENLGFNGNAHTKRVPNWMFSERPKIRKAFVQGFVDAEGEKRGTKMKTWNTTIRLCNKNLLEDIKQLWESIGYHASEIKEIQEPERWIKDTYVPSNINWQLYVSETEVPFHDEIILVRKEQKEDVYDLTVEHPSEHNFLCNGVPVSNTRAPERRVFYIDVGQLPPFKAEAFLERMKDQFRKKKVANTRSGSQGASAVEERWHAPAADEDYWIPIRPNANTRVETLPGAQNLGEIDDAVYFRNKLYTALNFPKNYQASEDPQATRITLSAQDVKFAKLIERLQGGLVDGTLQIAETHLELRGYPEEEYEDLEIIMTPPSAWRELSLQEIITNRINNANSLKSSMLISDFDILTKWMKYSEEEAMEMISRNKIQKLEDLKLQIIGQNPQLLGVGTPGEEGEPQMGTEAGGPNPMMGPEGQPPPGGEMPPGGETYQSTEGPPSLEQGGASVALSEPSQEEIKKYDLEIQNYASQIDDEEIDFSELQ